MSDWYQYPTNFTNSITNVSNDSVDGVAKMFGSYPASQVSFFGAGMVTILWMIFFGLSYGAGAIRAILVSSFITGILSVYLWRIGLIDAWIIFLMIALTIFGAIGSMSDK